MKKLFTLFLCISLTLGICPITALAAPEWPSSVSIQADGGIVMDANTGAVLYGQNIHQPYFPASITKILTALIVIENCSMDETVTFSHNAVYNVEAGSSSAGLDEGDQLSVEECLYAMLLKSANEAANALAEHVAGTTEDFAVMMNEKAASLGCTDSNFVNPSGLNNENHVTSAYDMALISRAALQNETFVTIDSTLYYDLPVTKRNPEGARIYPGHKMLKKNQPEYYEGVFGGKTGYTSLAGNTLVTFAQKGDMKLITVVLNGHQTHYEDTKALLDFGFQNFQTAAVQDDFLNHESDMTIAGLPAGDMSAIYIEQNGRITLPNQAELTDAVHTVSYDLTDIDPENAIARIQYTYGDTDRKIGSFYLMADPSKVNPEPVVLTPLPGETLLESDSTGSAGDSIPETDSQPSKEPTDNDSQVKAFQIPSIVWKVLIALAIIAGIIGLLISVKLYLEQKEERERRLRRERRKQRLRDIGVSDSEFEKLIEERRSRKQGRFNQE